MALGGLPVLSPLLKGSDPETVTAAVAALRNLSIHKGNEVGVVEKWVWWRNGCVRSIQFFLYVCTCVCVCGCLVVGPTVWEYECGCAVGE